MPAPANSTGPDPSGGNWLDKRAGLNSVLRTALEEPIPGGARWAYIFGSALVLLFVSQVVTGVALALYYVPAANDAHVTVAYIVKVVTAGSFVRSLHSYGASAIVIVLLLHIIQTFFYGAYKGRRELVWIAGCILFGLMLAMAFTGYLLPWDQKAYFGTAVGTNVIGELPLLGNYIRQLLRGGNQLGTVGLSRFFVLHVFVLPGLIAALAIIHIYLFRKAGPAGPIAESATDPKLPTEPFYPRQFGRDLVFVVLLVTILAALSHFFPVRLGPEANPSDTAYLPRPEWYFLPLFQWLKLWPGGSALIGVVVLPTIVAILFVAAPFLDRSLQRHPLRRPLAIGGFCVVLGGLALLGVLSYIQDRRDPAVVAQMAKQERAVQAFMGAPFGREPAASADPDVKTAEQVFKNIQVLQGTPADQLVLGMHIMEGELGVDCVYCHVSHDGSTFYRDDRPTKQTARKMMAMVNEINKNTFGGQQVVTCYTCHQGHTQPVSLVRLPLASDELKEKESEAALPTADQILANYVKALGGEPAIRKITSRVIVGTQDLATGPGGKTPLPVQLERYEKAPNLVLTIDHAAKGDLSEGFDGTKAWSQDLKGSVSTVMPDLDQVRAKRAADFYESLDLRGQYNELVVQDVVKIGERDAYLVEGFPQDDSPELLYFDTKTGLLLRKITVLPTPLGESPFQLDYDDYRDAGSGVKLPFVIRMTPGSSRSEPQTHSTFRVQKVQENAPIDNAKFMRPQPENVAAK